MMTEARGGAVARAMAPRMSMMRFNQISWVGPKGGSVREMVPKMRVATAAKLQVT